ncbi:hypothetical protein ACS5NO_16995 [Larkinella sp. GY13]|uniref:hypothetical protein n=1 Tax=Larkinella sp. GY13 TaxID=3453720 RepID=UPI003EEAE851
MRPFISEFSFGYAITEEIIRHQRHLIDGAPIFPSLLQEGSPGGGYDLKINRIGFPLFLQFKLSHKMVKKSSFEIKDHSLFSTPFFRIHIMPLKLSQQHNMLLSLDDGNNEVYYVAPFFTTQSEINLHYSNRAVISNSIFIKPNTIGNLPDDDEHHISLEQHKSLGYLFSKEPKTIEEIGYSEKFLADMLNKLEQEYEMIDTKIERISRQMLGIISDRIEKDSLLNRLYDLPKNLALLTYLSRLYFDCEVILALR